MKTNLEDGESEVIWAGAHFGEAADSGAGEVPAQAPNGRGETADAGEPKARPGRPSGCTPETLGLLKSVIRELGLTDCAAARRLGIGLSTLSRWKRADPEVRMVLQQAREECRAIQLQRIMQAAAAEHGRGWRAAAWLLERLFPEDYAPHAGAREGHRQVAEARELREEREAEAAERVRQVRLASRKVEPVNDAESTQEEDCRNCQNVGGEAFESATALESSVGTGALSCSGSEPREGQLSPPWHDLVQLDHELRERVSSACQALPPDAAMTWEGDCQNCRNAPAEVAL